MKNVIKSTPVDEKYYYLLINAHALYTGGHDWLSPTSLSIIVFFQY